MECETGTLRGWNSSDGSVEGSPSCMMQLHGFDRPLSCTVEGICFLGVNIRSDSTPYNHLLDESVD